MTVHVLEDGPGDHEHVLVLAHGSGTAMDEAPMPTFAAGVAAFGIDVIRFEFPYMQARRLGDPRAAPDADDVLLACFNSVVGALGGARKLIVGGWSRGGRIAARLAAELQPAGLACLAYPFHPIGEPRSLDAVERLRSVRVPTLIVQGTRDAFGNREQVRGYRLASNVALHWLEDGNHALRPRPRSGLNASAHLDSAIAAVAGFILAR